MILVVLYYYDVKYNDQILRFFLCISASTADAAVVNPKGIKTLLANGLITFFVNGSPVFNNGPSSLPRNPFFCFSKNEIDSSVSCSI